MLWPCGPKQKGTVKLELLSPDNAEENIFEKVQQNTRSVNFIPQRCQSEQGYRDAARELNAATNQSATDEILRSRDNLNTSKQSQNAPETNQCTLFSDQESGCEQAYGNSQTAADGAYARSQSKQPKRAPLEQQVKDLNH